MRLKWVSIQNFRCIHERTVNLRDYTSLIGPNNAGKSSLLRAIQLLLDPEEKPEPEEWRKGFEHEPIVLEGCFEELQSWEKALPGLSSLICDGEIRLRGSQFVEQRRVFQPFRLPDRQLMFQRRTLDGLVLNLLSAAACAICRLSAVMNV